MKVFLEKLALGFILVALSFSFVLFLAGPSFSQKSAIEDDAGQLQEKLEFQEASREEKLDILFAKLKKAKNPADAQVFSRQIWNIWAGWDDDAIDLLMSRSQNAIDARQFAAALDILDQIIAIEPRHSEAWNRRATVHFFNGDFELSIADVEQTLALEPRHFGALTGLSRMLTALGEREKAIIALRRALEIYPALEGAQAALIILIEQEKRSDL